MKIRITANFGFLVTEVPNFLAPVLQVHVSQVGSIADEQFDGTAVHRGSRFVAGRFGQHGRFRTFFNHDQRVTQITATVGHQAGNMNRLIHRHVSRNVQEHAVGPHRSMQRRKAIKVWIDQLEQVLLNQVAVLGQ